MADDEVLDALHQLLGSLDRIESSIAAVRERAELISAERLRGRGYLAILDVEHRPLIVELLTEMTDELHETGSCFRRAEARALHDEGLTMEGIAEMFGVTRQRISALLRDRDTG